MPQPPSVSLADMGETIRDHFTRVRWRIAYANVSGLIVALGIALYAFARFRNSVGRLGFAGFLTAGTLLTAGMLALLPRLLRGRLLCPRCGADIFRLFQESSIDRAHMPWDVWAACPKCQKSFADSYR